MSDDELLRGLSRLLAQSRRVESDLVAHIAEVDERRLWAREAFPSMFAYCTGALRLSESEAYLRIAVGRASRAFPSILQRLADGRAHLSGIALLAPHLTPANVEWLLARAAFKSKREIEELIAELAPRPDARPTIRRLPVPMSSAGVLPIESPTASAATSPAAATASPGASAATPSSPPAAPAPATPAGPSSALSAPPFEPWTLSGMGRTVTPASTAPPLCSSRTPDPGRSPRPVQPLSSDRFKVQFTATGALVRKLERLCALMGPKCSTEDLAAVIDAVVSEKLERLEARRFGAKVRSPFTRTAGKEQGLAGVDRAAANGVRAAVDGPAGLDGPASARQSGGPRTAPISRRIPASVRRTVFDRDGGRCTYLDASGRRCPERDRLEYHHRHPFGLGGGHRPENLCLMCRAHNALQAENDFGRRTMAGHRAPGAPRTEAPGAARTEVPGVARAGPP